MFDKLKKSFGGFVDLIRGTKITESDIANYFEKNRYELLETDLSLEVIDHIQQSMTKMIASGQLEGAEDRKGATMLALRNSISELFPEPVNFENMIRGNRAPYVITFLGINGSGKTTTVAKVAKMLKGSGLKVLMCAADTYRAGAIEQLSYHARAIGVNIIQREYGSDPASVARDAVDHARSNNYDAVLLDTAGRMQTNDNLLEELNKLVKVSRSNLNVFVGDALSGNDIIEESRVFLQKPGFDTSIVAKMDADTKGGSVINLAWATKKPVSYFGVGQGYDDLIPFNRDWLLERLLS
ncbi:MAG: signal recognition particle-docking protein FtsY [Nitrososphaerota archaeon]|jgi:fused signal recognition particle receptor|nr:signal recognition particle-docking protein FtsY [Nitrososphaerota archaeon]MDG6930242.1 signal recognition particle-docking protein FtsY [Nitrososphaerota archaeon]MDG6932634.1 signal recognition particle-docking protein FtsY [Nitrososphaerota archaeon]MDG6935574.1 signal recognition particle-docking protein FtsY [Nitrososphaerota archaeon]MDG6944018.1 signal recognition particle-docking protein FtsY [Nitrososphaerota archaeon]